ncbi:NAD-P-binding protein [Trametes maxima]|nr:NAD-P-binding protein [Trametes maxima]
MILTTQPLVWFITGASSGLGRELVLAALKRGDSVVATARSIEKIEGYPQTDRLRALQLDVTEGYPSIKAKVEEAIRTYFGRIDVVVNNAGTGYKAILEEAGSDVLRKQYDTNLFGLLDVTNAVLPHMRSRRNGTIVLIGSRSSWSSEIPGAGKSSGAVRVLGETLNAELAPFGLRTLIVEPGGFVTNSFSDPWYEDNRIADYDALLEAAKQGLATAGANFRGDPAKAMELLVDVVRGEGRAAGKAWPLYLPMGELAVNAIRGKATKMLEVVEEWQDVIGDLNFEK